MKHTSEITIHAPLGKVFTTASDVARWPEFLPHYRYNRFLSHTPSGGVVKMSCTRAGIATTWLAEYRIDTKKRQLHFRHLKSTLNATLGMKIVWKFKELPGNRVQISITHDLQRPWHLIGLAATDWILGRFFVNDIASKTLAGLKRKVESQVRHPVLVVNLPG